MRRTHNKELKFAVAIEAIKGDLTTAQIMSKYGIAESLIHKWKNQLLKSGNSIFERGSSHGDEAVQKEINKLHATIGKLKVENDFLEYVLVSSGKKRKES
jgi:transposase